MVYDQLYGVFENEEEYNSFLMEHLGHIDFDNPPIHEKYQIPYEMYKYYVDNRYAENGIPLSLTTAKEIFEILKAQNSKDIQTHIR